MKNLIDSYKKTGKLHHAYAIEGDKETALKKLINFFENDAGFATKANPDFWLGDYDSFGVDDARSLAEMQLNKSFNGTWKVFVLSVSSMTREAQNSLLKIFEEPTDGAHFFIIIPSADTLLPTLKSRLMIESAMVGENYVEEFIKTAEKFIKAQISARMQIIEKVAKDKDKNSALSLLNGLEIVLNEKLNVGESDFLFLGELLELKRNLNQKGASIKQILEFVALFCPRF